MKPYLKKIDTETRGNRYDVTPLFLNHDDFSSLVTDLVSGFAASEIDCVGCIDSLGFILGTAIAQKMNVGIVPIRKGGKFPVATDSQTFCDYSGQIKTLEIRQDILTTGMRVLIVDEWVETGAQISAAIDLIEGKQAVVAGIATINMDDNECTRAIRSKYKVKSVWEDKLTFQPYEGSQSEKLAHWIVDENWPFHGSKCPTLDQVRKSISNGFYTGEDNKTFWIYLDCQPEPVGIISLHEFTDITPIFDLRLKSSVRNRGIGRKIVNWLAHYVFTQTDKHRIEGHTRVDNIAMRRVFKACGWVKEAYYRKAWPDSESKYYDAVTYALLKSDWQSGTSTTIDWNEDL